MFQNRANKWAPMIVITPCCRVWEILTISINYIRWSISLQRRQLSHSSRISLATKWIIGPSVVKTEIMTHWMPTGRQMSHDHSPAAACVCRKNQLSMLLRINNSSNQLNTSLGTQISRHCHQTIIKTSSNNEPFLPTTMSNRMWSWRKNKAV